jgi:uncharacterized RDD family membrane protein YckC
VNAPASLRAMAKLIDFLAIAVLLGAATRMWGALWALPLVYLLVLTMDGLGVTPGKRLFGLRAVDAKTGQPCGIGQSVLRNLVFLPSFGRQMVKAVSTSEAAQTAVGVLAIVGIMVVIQEWRWMATRRDGRRLGDAFGDTRVVRGRG